MGKKRSKKKEIPFISEPTVILRNSGTLIRPFIPGNKKDGYSYIETITSYWDDVTFDRIPVNGFSMEANDDTGEYMFLCDKKQLSALQAIYPTYNIYQDNAWRFYNMYDPVQMSEEFSPTPIQLDIISRYNQLKNRTSVFINMPTASGKTLTGIYLAAQFGKRTLIMCYKKDVLDQWYNSFLKFTDISEDQMLMINGSAHIDKLYEEMKDPGYIYEGPSIVFCTTVLFHNLIHRKPDLFTDMIRRFGFGLKIVDEAHKHPATITKMNALTNIPRSIYMSAEFRRANRQMDKFLFSTFFNTNVLKPEDKFIDDFKYTVGVVVEYNSFPSDVEHDGCFGRRGFAEFPYMRYQYEKGTILNVLDELMLTITKIPGKIIIFTNLIEHVDLLFSHFVPLYGQSRKIARLYGDVDDVERSIVTNDADLIISTYKSLDTGTDIRNIKHIVSTVPVDIITDNQAAGRSRPLDDGSNAFYYILSDVGFKYVKKKTKTRLQSLQERKLVDLFQIRLSGE